MPDPTHPITAISGYVGRGWPVFACNTQKRPKTENGFHDAHLDFERHRDHWVNNPADTIGIATGYSNGSGLLVVDLDSYKEGGHPEWDALSLAGGLPGTFATGTGQGGLQLWFTVSEVIGSTTETIRGDGVRNVDTRCDGGYVIAPPSVTIFGPYTVIDDRDPVPAPEWLVEFAKRRKGNGGGVDGYIPVTTAAVAATLPDLTPAERERLDAYADSAVRGEIRRLVECREAAVAPDSGMAYRGPGWDQTVFEVACNLLELANSPWNRLTETEAHTILLAESPYDSGFSEARVVGRWDSARKRIGDSARPVPSLPSGGGFFIPFEGGDGGVIDPGSFFVKGEGLNVTLLAQAVLDMGPLAVEDNRERATWSYRRGVWVESPNEISDRIAVLLGARFRPNHVATVTPSLKQRLTAQGHVITCEPVPEFVNCLNGMLRWRTGELLPHSPSYYSTCQLPVEWDAGATCRGFEKFVAAVMPPDAVDYLWEVLGYMVFSGNPLQKAVLFHGAGANGKGTLIRVLTALLGERNTSSVTLADITEGKFEVVSLFGKIANLAGDIDPAYLRSTAKFKAITGEDTISAQRKFEAVFNFKCWATPLFSANEFWKSADTTMGYKRRWVVVPFPNTFTVSPGFSEELSVETAGILVGAVVGLQRLMERGEFAPPESAREEKERFELAADQVMEWLSEDPAIVTADPTLLSVETRASDAYQAYRSWAEQNGSGALNASKWKQRMESMGYGWRKSGERKVVGLGIDRQLNHLRHFGQNASLHLSTVPDL